MPTDQEIAQLAKDRYRDDDILIEVRPWVKRVSSGAWVEARVWVPLAHRDDCERIPDPADNGWLCMSEDSCGCPHIGDYGLCNFDKEAEQEWKIIVHGG